jgi:mannose-1-phosphate guanylyltransferase
MNANKYCIIMAGGIGSRFWPMSRTAHPKQFLVILGNGKSLLQQTYERFLNICPAENIFVVTNDIYIDLVTKQLPLLSPLQVIGEPSRRNTAPCIAYATHKIYRLNPLANIVVAPSDHVIMKEEAFCDAIRNAFDFTEKNDELVTLGIKPGRPDTGYGYIQFNNDMCDIEHNICKVKTFTEKPNAELASFFLESGDFLWNSGIFVWNAKTILDAFEKFLPEMNALFLEGKDFYNTENEQSFIVSTYSQCTNISIDYGILEKAQNVWVMSADLGWSDLGTWGSLYEHLGKDGNGNAIIGNNVLSYDTSGCIVNIPKGKLLVMQGLEDYIVVESDNVLLICKKDNEQQIRDFVNDVKIHKDAKYI